MALVYRTEPAKIVSQVAEAAKDCIGAAGEHIIMLADFEGSLLSTLKENELTGLRNLTTRRLFDPLGYPWRPP